MRPHVWQRLLWLPLWLGTLACGQADSDAQPDLGSGIAPSGTTTGSITSATQSGQTGPIGPIGAAMAAQPSAGSASGARAPALSGASGVPPTAANASASGGAPATQGAAGASAPTSAASAGAGADMTAAAGAEAAGTAGMAAAPSNPALPPAPVPDPLQWTRCGSFECAELKVPLDYADPTGEQITLAVQRRTTRGQRIGSLLINPGGPGGSAIDFLASFVQSGSALLQRFDLVAFDPRGVGQSTPLNCHSTIQKLAAVDPSPDDEAEWTAADAAAKAFADECGQKYAKLLPHMATPNVARDMDQVRAALGEDKLSYLGFSYGTAIGARYAELFPERVRALVLDGALDMSLSALEISLAQAVGFESALKTYFDWCARSAANCGWTNGASAADAFQQLSAKIDAQPINALTGDRPLGPGEFLLGVIAPLYSGDSGYRALSSALGAAVRGDGSALLSFTDNYLDRHSDGSYGDLQEANNAVNCLDEPAPDYRGVRAQEMHFAMTAPTFGVPILTGLLVCSHWPAQGQMAPVPKGAGAAPILVVGTTGDPATPYAWAQALASELESGVLLTYEGEGHTAYLRSVPCIDDAVEGYLIDGTVPEAGKRCSGNSSPSPLTHQVQGLRGPLTPRAFGHPVTE